MSLRSKKTNVHFIGIGGIGMSGIAEILCRLGHQITGSDQYENKQVENLRKLGIEIQIGHSDEILKKNSTDVVVYSNAIPKDNPEWIYAKQYNIPIIRRAEMLAEIMNLKRGIAIAGSHGKTTTTGLVSLILRAANLDPTIVIGGQFKAISSNASLGGGQWMVTEADESDGSFLKLNPEISVVTNIDREHLDFYHSEKEIIDTFFQFIDKVPFYGNCILCSDDERIYSLKEQINKPCLYYGTKEEHEPDFLISDISLGPTPSFSIYSKGGDTPLLCINMSVPGIHNILNATAAALVGIELGIDKEIIAKALSSFKGVDRRYELKGIWKGFKVIEDYAHHPTEIKATLKAAIQANEDRKPLVVFQPHRYSRTIELWEEFKNSFDDAQEVLVLPIYPGSEKKENWMKDKSEKDFVQQLHHPTAQLVTDFQQIKDILEKLTDKKEYAGKDIFLLGAGDIFKLSPFILN